MSSGLWNIYADAAKLDTASLGWSDLSTALDTAGSRLVTKSKNLVGSDWEGEDATTYQQHRGELITSLDRGSELAGDVSSTLTNMAGVVRIAQGHLDLSWATVSGISHQGSPSGDVRFDCKDDAEVKLVDAAVARAEEVRATLDKNLAADKTQLDSAVTGWNAIASKWYAIAEQDLPPFTLPADIDGVGVIPVGDKTYVNTGAGDDTVKITVDPVTGEQIVTINGQTYRVPAGQEVVVRTGEGDDIIEVPKGTTVNVTALAGNGDDRVSGRDGDDRILAGQGDDEVDAGAGDDQVSGGTGRDYLDGQTGDDEVAGNAGDDTIYGLDGDDSLLGGPGQDYLEGGKDDDTLLGGEGNDIQSGGKGDDTIVGGEGDDVSYAGRGDDTTYGGTGKDTSNEESGDTSEGDVENQVTVEIEDLSRFINIKGSPEFVARVEADLEMLRGSPRGQQMLEALQEEHDNSGGWFGIGRHELTISEYPTNDNSSANSGEIKYSPRVDSIDGAPPAGVLYHEMAHVYDFWNDNFDETPYSGDDPADDGDKQGERTAVGLPVDHDHDPSTPEVLDPDHPFELTENGLREEMGVDDREHY